MASYTRATTGADTISRSQPSVTRTASGATASARTQPASTPSVVSGAVEQGQPPTVGALTDAEVSTFGMPARMADRIRPFEMGLFLPDSFRDVPVEIVDTDGERITDTIWVMTSHAFGTASKVEDGKGTVTMVAGLGYEQFIGIGDRERTEKVDYAWYSVDEHQQTINPPVYERKQIVLDTRRIQGLYAGSAVDFGGQLG